MDNKKHGYQLVFITIAICLAQKPARAFDCAKASSSVEKLICQTPSLKKEDTEMEAQWSTIMKSQINPQAKELLRLTQRQWLKVRETITDPNTLGTFMEQKLRYFQGLTQELGNKKISTIRLGLEAPERSSRNFGEEEYQESFERSIVKPEAASGSSIYLYSLDDLSIQDIKIDAPTFELTKSGSQKTAERKKESTQAMSTGEDSHDSRACLIVMEAIEACEGEKVCPNCSDKDRQLYLKIMRDLLPSSLNERVKKAQDGLFSWASGLNILSLMSIFPVGYPYPNDNDYFPHLPEPLQQMVFAYPKEFFLLVPKLVSALKKIDPELRNSLRLLEIHLEAMKGVNFKEFVRFSKGYTFCGESSDYSFVNPDTQNQGYIIGISGEPYYCFQNQVSHKKESPLGKGKRRIQSISKFYHRRGEVFSMLFLKEVFLFLDQERKTLPEAERLFQAYGPKLVPRYNDFVDRWNSNKLPHYPYDHLAGIQLKHIDAGMFKADVPKLEKLKLVFSNSTTPSLAFSELAYEKDPKPEPYIASLITALTSQDDKNFEKISQLLENKQFSQRGDIWTKLAVKALELGQYPWITKNMMEKLSQTPYPVGIHLGLNEENDRREEEYSKLSNMGLGFFVLETGEGEEKNTSETKTPELSSDQNWSKSWNNQVLLTLKKSQDVIEGTWVETGSKALTVSGRVWNRYTLALEVKDGASVSGRIYGMIRKDRKFDGIWFFRKSGSWKSKRIVLAPK